MLPAVLTAADALATARESYCYLLRVRQSEAAAFNAPGWTRLEPPRDGAVLFIHRDRELLAVRSRGVL